MTRTFLNNAISFKYDNCWRKWLWNVLPMFRINHNKVLYLLSVGVRPRKWCFPREFKNCAVLTKIKPEQPGQSLRKPQEKLQCRQGGFLTVLMYIPSTVIHYLCNKQFVIFIFYNEENNSFSVPRHPWIDTTYILSKPNCLMAHSPVKCEIPKNTRPRHLKIFRTQYIFVSNCFW